MAFAPLWAGSGIVSVLGAIFVVIAIIRRRRRNTLIRAKWDHEEQILRARRWLFNGRPQLHVVRSPSAPATDDGVPRVETEQGPRTLH